MKVIAINGSMRETGNTFLMIQKVFAVLNEQDIDTEIINIGKKTIGGCTGCRKCFTNQDMKCVLEGDFINDLFKKLATADAIIIGSPVYFGDMTANVKAFIERIGMLNRANHNPFAKKPGAAVVAVRRAGAVNTFNNINLFFTISQMIVVGSSYWNMGLGREIGEIDHDLEAIQTMQTLGQNMAWLLKKLS